MIKGFVLIVIEPSFELEVYEKLLEIDEIVEVMPTLGSVDFVVETEAENHDDIADVVLNKIRIIKGVASTKTFIEDEFMKTLVGMIG